MNTDTEELQIKKGNDQNTNERLNQDKINLLYAFIIYTKKYININHKYLLYLSSEINDDIMIIKQN